MFQCDLYATTMKTILHVESYLCISLKLVGGVDYNEQHFCNNNLSANKILAQRLHDEKAYAHLIDVWSRVECSDKEGDIRMCVHMVLISSFWCVFSLSKPSVICIYC